jgi:hypothetical protein
MPLEYAKPGTPGFGRNVEEMIASGHPQRQAVAAAYSAAGETKDDDPTMMNDDPDDTADAREGFEKVERSVAQDPKVRDPAAVAAAIGMKKMGKEAFERKAHAGDDASVFGSFDPIRGHRARDADDPDIAPAVEETEVHALNRQVERPVSDNPEADPAFRPATTTDLPNDGPEPVNYYMDPGFRNPTPDSAVSRQVGPSLRDQNAAARAYWNGRR